MKDLVEKWCKWFYSIPKEIHPAIDDNGRNAYYHQTDPEFFFLCGSFGNMELIQRKFLIPSDRKLFFPVLSKECSFAEDTDLRTESQLIQRCINTMDQIVHMEVRFDNNIIQPQRVCSDVFDLDFPENNVYDVIPGRTRAVIDGYWVLLKPLKIAVSSGSGTGNHKISIVGECMSEITVVQKERKLPVCKEIWQNLDDNGTFCLNILYNITAI